MKRKLLNFLHVSCDDNLENSIKNNELIEQQILGEGDYCTILRSTNNNHQAVNITYCLFVARHLMHSTYTRPRQELLWLSVKNDGKIVLLHSEVVNGIPSLQLQCDNSKLLDSVKVERTGFLPGGKNLSDIQLDCIMMTLYQDQL